MIFHWIVLVLYAYDLHKNAEKAGVISFLSQILYQTAVHCPPALCLSPTDSTPPYPTYMHISRFATASPSHSVIRFPFTHPIFFISRFSRRFFPSSSFFPVSPGKKSFDDTKTFTRAHNIQEKRNKAGYTANKWSLAGGQRQL